MNEYQLPPESEGGSELEKKIKKMVEKMQDQEILLEMVAPRRKDYYEKERRSLEMQLKTQVLRPEYQTNAQREGLEGVTFGYVSVDHPRGMGWVEINESGSKYGTLSLIALARMNVPMKAFWHLRGDTFNQEGKIERDAQKIITAGEIKSADPVMQMQYEIDEENRKKADLAKKIETVRTQGKMLAGTLRKILNDLGFEDITGLYEAERENLPPISEENANDYDYGERMFRGRERATEENTLIALSFKRRFQK
ncbi:MAG: hypothetical protein M1383_02800 [Patescibacteria group bacterium]|nr:hypothetical protein [Patescibacteria group bacterium]